VRRRLEEFNVRLVNYSSVEAALARASMPD